MNSNSTASWSQAHYDDPMTATTGDEDFSTFLDLQIDFPNFDCMQNGQPGLDTPMGDLGMDQLGMGGPMEGTTMPELQQNTMSHQQLPMTSAHDQVKTKAGDAAMHAQMIHQHHNQTMQSHGYQPQLMVPLTPQSSEFHGAAARYQHHVDMHGNIIYDRGQMSFTPLVSPAVSFQMPDYAVPGEYFSPLTSPTLEAQPHHRPTYTSTPGSETGATSSPIDLSADSNNKPTGSGATTRRSKRKPSTSTRTPARSVRQSPLVRPQGRRKQSLTTGGLPEVVPEDKAAASRRESSARSNESGGSSLGSGPDSVSPEPLSDTLMPPPTVPRSVGRSPNIQAQVKSPIKPNVPATPSTLMRLDKARASASPRPNMLKQPSAESQDHLDDLMLPEALTSSRPILSPIDTTRANADDQLTPTLTAKTPKLTANSTPRTSVMSPRMSSDPTGAHKKSESKSGLRTAKKRQSTSSAQISPALMPKISPSIQPLIPASAIGVPALSAETSALYLASKSNYQHILEGTHLPGVSYPEALAENLSSKRTSHKIAEQGRRNRINSALREIESLLPPSATSNAKKERSSSNDGDDGDKAGVVGQGNSKASTVEMAIVYIRALQQELGEVKSKLEAAEKKLAEGNSSDSRASE